MAESGVTKKQRALGKSPTENTTSGSAEAANTKRVQTIQGHHGSLKPKGACKRRNTNRQAIEDMKHPGVCERRLTIKQTPNEATKSP